MSDWDFGASDGSVDPTGMDSSLYGDDGGLIDVQQYTSDPSGDWFGVFDTAINSVVSQTSGGGDWNSQTQPVSMGKTFNFNDPGSTQPGGVAAGVGDASSGGNWWDAAMKWFDDDKNNLKGSAAVSLAGSFLKGLFGSFAEKRTSKNVEKMANASQLNAQTNSEVAAKKFENASSIGNTNFGAPPPGGLIYSNKLEPRQKRAGYTGVA